jgi:FkbH-like protein
LEFYLRLLGLDPELHFEPPYRLPEAPLDAPWVLVLVDFDKFTASTEARPAEAWRRWLAHIRGLAPTARLLVTEPLPLPRGTVVPSDSAVAARDAFDRTVVASCAEHHAVLIRWSAALQELGWSRIHRPAHYLHYDQLLTHEGLVRAAQVLARHIAALGTPRKKIIVLDGDNTLWAGLAGEVGPESVDFLPDSARGRCYHRVLKQLQALSEAGVLLAVVSKNEPATVLAVLARPGFPLKPGDFAAMRLNWEPKSANLRSIAEELNVALDAFIFIDDSEQEILEVTTALPEVESILVPRTLEEYPALLPSLPGLDRVHLTAEDHRRKGDYRAQADRRRLQQQNPGDFLARLAVQVDVRLTTPGELPRFSQLVAKTNQFRLIPEKPGEEELRAKLADPRWRLHSIYYRDVFGDSGLVGAALLERGGDTWCLHNFVLSCRVLGRGVEQTVLAEWSRRYQPLEIRFVPSGRNQVAERTLRLIGWVASTPLPPWGEPVPVTLHHA